MPFVSDLLQVGRKGTGFLSANDLKAMGNEDEAEDEASLLAMGVVTSLFGA